MRGGGGPVGPWGPYIERIARAGFMSQLAAGTRAQAEVLKLALNEVEVATKQLGEQIAKQQQR